MKAIMLPTVLAGSRRRIPNKMAIMRCIFLFVILVQFCGCFLFGNSQSNTKIIYKTNLENGESVKIYFSNAPYNKSFIILINRKNKLTDRFDITDNPKRFIINKLILAERDSRALYRIISDSSNNRLKCIDFDFLRTENNENALQTFVPLSAKERKVLSFLPEVVRTNKLDFKISEDEINRFIGWVKLYY